MNKSETGIVKNSPTGIPSLPTSRIFFGLNRWEKTGIPEDNLFRPLFTSIQWFYFLFAEQNPLRDYPPSNSKGQSALSGID